MILHSVGGRGGGSHDQEGNGWALPYAGGQRGHGPSACLSASLLSGRGSPWPSSRQANLRRDVTGMVTAPSLSRLSQGHGVLASSRGRR